MTRRAEKLIDDHYPLSPRSFVEMVVWRVSDPVPGSRHRFKYRLAFIVEGVCVLRYDNEAGKGDHRHWKGHEAPYNFADLDTLQADFWRDVEAMT
jgi:Family of unknown function (DUF6516)